MIPPIVKLSIYKQNLRIFTTEQSNFWVAPRIRNTFVIRNLTTVMGIPGLLKEIGKGERIALSKLAVEFLERNRRPIRIAIDTAIWQFQNQAGQGGQNPALRTFYYRLLRILALPIHPLFVYDGPRKPLAKRNKVVFRYGTTSVHDEMSKKLLQLFRFPYQTAPGEAEAECALLQREGIVDAVMSQDVDAVMWGSTMTLRDWSQEGTRGNKTATHVNVLRAETTKVNAGLDPDGMILVALLSGGDYAPEGISGFGAGLACEIAKAHFGSDLLEVMAKGDREGLLEWKERLQYELETNESGYFKTRHKSVKIPGDFPDETLLRYYTHPEVSSPVDLQRIRRDLESGWDGDINTGELREYVAQTFNWQYRGGACKFIRSMAPALLAQRLLRGQKNTTISSSDAISERRMHFISDGMPELRIAVVPADIVGLNIEDEEDNPEYVQAMEEGAAAEEEINSLVDQVEPEDEPPETTQNASRPRKKAPAPWDPRNPEKMWLPETIVKLGLPDLVGEWEQKQRDMLTDAQKFIANKARKVNSSTAASQKTKSIHAYFTTSKSAVAGPSERPASPKKAAKDPIGHHEERHIRASSTPIRRKTRAKVTDPTPAPAASINPFSLASQVKPASSLKKSSLFPSSTNTPLPQASANPSLSGKPPTRRARKPLQKSKTLPTSFEQPILISSSPVPSPHHPRSLTPPPPSLPSRAAAKYNLPSADIAQHHRSADAVDRNPNPPHSDSDSDSDSLPSPSQLLHSLTNKKTTTTTTTTHNSAASSSSLTSIPQQPIKPTPSDIFRQHATTTATAIPADLGFKCGGNQMKKKTVLSRDSLPGTWMEVLESDGVSAEAEAGLGGRSGRGRGRRGMPMARVSLVDLTDL
ncbi:hypothetical protein GJ744_012445 [Endocarpon pusillum]|uniref:XPG-I domain-containing protein n=1 Tax=Endocarpon pusillum TaxID=364733 RepID=A0A8H7AIS8_9EURO|nr:hypothetical protein GJ744_012445 [Endocarpon pusillum]